MSSALQLVFVVGYPRSGTTLLATLLDRHSHIAATPETHFFNKVIPAKAESNDLHDAKKSIDHFLASTRVADLGLTANDFSALLEQRECTWRDIFSRALSIYGEQRAATIVVEKTPFHMAKVGQILEWYPDAKIIHITRDGRDSVMSLIEATWTHNNLRRHAANWRWQMKLMRKFRQVNPNKIYELRYEQLLSDPETSLRGVCEYIGVEFEISQLEIKTVGNAITAWESGWKGKAADRLDQSRIQAWQRTVSNAQRYTLNSMMGVELRQYGYPDTGVRDYEVPVLVRAKNLLLNPIHLAVFHPTIKDLLARPKPVSYLLRMRTERILSREKNRANARLNRNINPAQSAITPRQQRR